MAPNTNIDCSQDILCFRQLISDALSRKLFNFDWAVAHLNQLLEDVPETQASGNIKARKSYSPKEAAARFPEYRDIIRTFIQYAEADREYVKEFFVWRACLQFAVIKKEITTLDCDFREIQPYSKVTPLWKEIASFLANSYWCDRVLTRSFLSDISNRISTLSVLNAVCDNPFLNRKDVQLGQAATLIEESLYNLGEEDQKLFAREIVAYQVALNLGTLNVLLNLRRYEWTAKDIAPASISPTDFAKFKEKVEFLPFGKTAFATYPEGKEEYRKVLDRILATAVEQGHISASEYDAVTGEAAAQSSLARENEHPVSTMNVPGFLPQAGLGGDAVTGSEGSKTDEVIMPKIQPTVVPSASLFPSISKNHRVTRPPRFTGVEGEKAFRHLYDLMVGSYFECDSPENFTGLFRCPSNEQIETYTKINWIQPGKRSRKPACRQLQYFIEALYRLKDADVPAKDIPDHSARIR